MRHETVWSGQESTATPAAPLLEIRSLSKSWGPTKALDSVGFSLSAGQVLALVGENGAGKSTLLHILSGVIQPDDGELHLAGVPLRFASPHEAQAHGIGTVFQELSLAKNLSVMENIFAGRFPSRFGFVDRSTMRRRTRELFGSLGLEIDPDITVGDLPVSSQQIVEIAKAVSLDAKVLLLDEPTSALNADEKAALFRLVRSLRAKGTGIIYISHHLDEVLDLADLIVVLRDGGVVSSVPRPETDVQNIVRAMTGRAIDEAGRARKEPMPDVLLDVRQLSDGEDVHQATFSVRKGEIVALAGLMGSGRGRLAEMLAGLAPRVSGDVKLSGRDIAPRGMQAAKRLGIGYIPPERKTQGLFLDLPVASNIAAATLPSVSRHGFIDSRAMADVARGYMKRLSIKAAGVDIHCRSLSGGNQQKVLFAKWLEANPSLLIVEEPTKGVDIAAKQDIHMEILALAARGTGVLVVSSDLPEILSIAHRVLVMHKGRIVADLDCRDATEHQIVAHASGLSETAHGI